MSSAQVEENGAGDQLSAVPAQAAGMAADGPGGAGGAEGFAADAAVATATSPVADPARATAPNRAAERGLPLTARVLLADLGVALVSLIVLIFIGVQRIGEASLHARRTAYVEDILVFFAVGALFGLVAYLLFRAGRMKVAAMQAVIAAVVVALGVVAAVAGDPKPAPVVPVEQSE